MLIILWLWSVLQFYGLLDMTKDKITFTVTLPTDSGFIGRRCKDSGCGKYFKIHEDSVGEMNYCPYCGLEFSKYDLLTDEQKGYVTEHAKNEATKYVQGEMNKMFRDFARKTSRNKFIKVSYKSSPHRTHKTIPRYKEKEVDAELICYKCSCNFQVYGIFGFCPRCKEENILIYEANINIIKQEVENANDKQRALRHAYSDLVSTFEIFCRKKASQFPEEEARFQNLFDARKFFMKNIKIDILESLDKDELLTIRRIFQKRHLYEHDEGVINEKYVRMIPEDKMHLNSQADLSIKELESGAQILRKIISKLID